mgnify:CR=1 FL=1|tara:strand:+ start:551 stop:985 length:435 start_codon:yes stop_codon:yes gene_type:complete
MKISIVNKSHNPLPEYKTTGSSGADVRASLSKEVLLQPQQVEAIPTGLFFDIPEGFEIQVRPRSGFALKCGVTVLNSPGTIDSDYRGELLIILINHSKRVVKINNGDRIAQIVISRVVQVAWTQTNVLTKTKRGEGGFGSTGKK